MRKTSALLLVLALHGLDIAAGQWFTNNEINGLADLCNVSSSNPDPHALSVTDCRDCVFELTSPSSTIEKSGRAYACHSVCQSNSVINQVVASSGAVTTFSSVVAGQRADLCTACLSRSAATPYGCQLCLQTNSANSDVDACMDCLELNPFANDPEKAYLVDSYQWACGQCQSIPVNEPTNTGAARAQCLACIASPTAQRTYPGILSAYEFASTTTDPNPSARDNDFGRCVYFANQTYLINTGSAEIKGIYESCKTGLQTSTKLQCAQCMFAAEQSTTSNPDNLSYKLQIATPKDWACASYCQDPAYQPSDVTLATSQSAKCEACVTDTDVQDAWACGNCLKLSKVPGASVDDCFANVRDDPYSGYASNYNWAVGMCAMIVTPALRELCLTCVRSQPLPQPDAAGVITNADFNTTTEANICSCVDLTLNTSIYTSRVLDPMEKQCFEPHKYHDENGVEQVPPIPWGVGFPLSSDAACLECMAQAVVVAPRNLNKKYACTQYCQDPALVKNQNQGQECAVCVVNPLVSNPWGCQNCMVATDDEASRRRCFQCVQTPNGEFDSHAWGCGMCAQFSNLDAQRDCFRCLTVGLDPCLCVDLARNGTVQDALPPQGTGTCDPTVFRVWYWSKSRITSLSWSLTSAPFLPNGQVYYSSALAVTAANSRLVPGAGAGGYDVFSLDIDVSGVGFATWNDIAGTKAWLNLANAVAGPAGGGVFWDASQSTANSADNIWSAVADDYTVSFFAIPQLALQVIDGCGGIVYDSIANYAFDRGGYTIKYDSDAMPVAARLFTLSPVNDPPFPLGPIATPQQLQLYPSLDGPVVTVTMTGPDTIDAPDLGYPAIWHTPGVGQVAWYIEPSLDARILTATTVGQPSYWDTTLSVFDAGNPPGSAPYIAANDDIYGSTSFSPAQCGGSYPGSLFLQGGQWCQLTTVSWAAPAGGPGYVLVLSGFSSIPQNHGPYAVKISSLPLAVDATVGSLHISTAETLVVR